MKIDHSKILNQLSTSTLQTGEESYSEESLEISPEAIEYINDVFKRLCAICPAWKQAFSSQEELEACKSEWITGFYDAKITKRSLVDYGMSELRKSGVAFIPTVGKFIEWCEEGKLPIGTLSGKDSYEEWFKYDSLPLERREPSNLTQATYHTMSVIFGSGMKGHLTASKPADAIKYWCSRYEATINKLKDGRPLKVAPEPTHKLDHIRQPASKQTAMSALAAMKKGLRGL